MRSVKQFGSGNLDAEEGKKSGRNRKKSDEEPEEDYYKDDVPDLDEVFNLKDEVLIKIDVED